MLQGSGTLWLAPTGTILEHISQGTWLQTQISLRKKKSIEAMFWFRSTESPWVALGLWAWLEVPVPLCSSPPRHLAPLYPLAHLCTGFNTRQAFLISEEGSHWPLPALSEKKKRRASFFKFQSKYQDDTIDLACVTCPFPEAKFHLGAFWLALSEAQRLEPAHVNHLAAGRGGVSFRDAGQTRSLTSSTVGNSPPAINTLVSTHDPVLVPRNSSLPWLTSPPLPTPSYPDGGNKNASFN